MLSLEDWLLVVIMDLYLELHFAGCFKLNEQATK